MSGLNGTFPLKVLTDGEVKKIYQGSVEILEEVGILFEDNDISTALREHGCTVCEHTHQVKIPSPLIEASLTKCPREFKVKSRNPKYDLLFNGTSVYFASHSAPSILDVHTGKLRKPSLADVSKMITLVDNLENIDVLLTVTGELSDKPAETGPEWVFAETFRKTEKTTVGPSFRDCPKWIIKMAEIVGVQIIGVTSCTPPLYYPQQDTDALLLYAKAGHPVTVGSGIAMGGTGPVTLAGSLVQQFAEALAGVVLVQSFCPGTGVFCLTETAPLDMKVGNLAWGSIEVALFHTAQAQISRYLGLQNFSLFPMSSSLVPDQQVGYEKGMQALIMALSGINFMSGGGGVHNESSLSFEQLIIDNDIYGMVKRFLKGIAVNGETLAVNAIKEVGGERGNFLKHPHTRTCFKQEHFFPPLSTRLTYQTWEKAGAKDIITRARERAEEIVKNHTPVPLPSEVEREMSELLKAVEKERLSTT